ncbi:hypothetical protein D3C85_801030 [compost metagenome]
MAGLRPAFANEFAPTGGSPHPAKFPTRALNYAVGEHGIAGGPHDPPSAAQAPLPGPAVARHAAGRRERICADGGRSHRPGHRRLPDPGHRACRGRQGAVGGAADRHARRPRYLHAQHHQGDPRQPGAGSQLRRPQRRAGGQRRHLHPLRQPYRRHGAGHQPGRSHAGTDRRHARPTGGRQAQRRQGREEGRQGRTVQQPGNPHP